jgi:hypothetical protein
MFYHVLICQKSNKTHDEVKLDLSEDIRSYVLGWHGRICMDLLIYPVVFF